MNDDLKLTDEQLRLATARSLPTSAALDAETASLRDGFIALGSAVESAAGPVDEAALMARLQRSYSDATADRAMVAARRPLHHDWLSLLVTGALAAAALIAIARIAIVSQPTDTVAVVTNTPALGGNDSVRSTLAGLWDDSLDDEIALAALSIDQLTSSNRGFDHSLLNMNERLQALSQELASESL